MSSVFQFSRAVEVLSPSQSCRCLDESSKADLPPNKLLQLQGRKKVTQTAVSKFDGTHFHQNGLHFKSKVRGPVY